MSIPKNIHLIWVGDEPNGYPIKYKDNVQSIISKNLDWNVKIWNEQQIKNLLTTYLGKEYLDKYESFKMLHQRVDFARYCILYIHGGVSVDMDVIALRSFNETPFINESDFIVSQNSTRDFINNATILVSKNNLLLKKFIDSINTDCKLEGVECIQKTTGPRAFTKFVNSSKGKITVLDNYYFEPCSGYQSNCKPRSYSILNHLHEGSWVNPSYKFALRAGYFIRDNKEVLLISIVIIIILFLV